MIKICSKCKVEKECGKSRSDCKDCQNQYREANKEAIAERKKQWRQSNKEAIAEKHKQYREANKKAIAERKKQYNKANKEAIAERHKKYYEANKKAIAEYGKQYKEANKEALVEKKRNYINNRLKTDPIFKFKSNVRGLIYNSFKRGTNQFSKKAKTEQILCCTIEQFREYIAAKFKKGMSFDNHGQWHLDHIVPLSIAATEEEIIKLNHYTNFQPLWAEDNLIKSDKIIETQLMLI